MESSRSVRPRLSEPDELVTLLCGHDESMRWMHVANNPDDYHDPLRPVMSSAPLSMQIRSSSTSSSFCEQDDYDDIANCPNLGVHTHVVRKQMADTMGLDRIIWNLQRHGDDVWGRVVDIAKTADAFYIGISCAIKQRYIGGVTTSGNTIVGHASTGYDAMEVLYHTSCKCAKLMERALIARVRDIRHHSILLLCRNKSDGGEGMSGNAPIYFVYVAYTLLAPQKTPDFSRWEPSSAP